MAVSAEVLRKIHRIHRQLADLRDRQQRGPRQVRAREANLAALNEALTDAQEAVKQTKLAVDRKQLDLKTGENKIEDRKAKLNSCSSNKEYQALLEQIAASEMAGSVLADEILEAMEKADQLEVAVHQVQQNVEATQSDLAQCRDTVAEEEVVICGDLQRLEEELLAAERNIPAEFKEDYRRVIRGKGAEGMAEVQDGVCLGCGQQITLNMQNDLMLSKPLFCKACGCLLYLSGN